MIQLIGLKRLIIIGALLLVNGLLAGAYFGFVTPMYEESKSEKSRIEREIRTLRQGINDIKADVKLLKESQGRYNELENIGFMTEFDNFRVQDKTLEIQNGNNLLQFSTEIGARSVEPDAQLKKFKYEILKQTISSSGVTSYFDTDIYNVVDDMNHDFYGHTVLKEFRIERKNDLNETFIKNMQKDETANGLFTAKYSFDFYTTVPENPDRVADDSNTRGRRR